MTLPSVAAPRPLRAAALVVLLEAVVFLALTVVQIATFSAVRAAMGWTTVAAFGLWALMLGLGGWKLLQGQSWARSPIVMAQLIHLGVAWSFVSGSHSTWQSAAAWFVAAAAVTVLIGLFHPRSIRHLAHDPAA